MLGDFDERFDKHFNRTQKAIWVGAVTSTITSIGVLVFVGWVVVKLLQHFGVI